MFSKMIKIRPCEDVPWQQLQKTLLPTLSAVTDRVYLELFPSMNHSGMNAKCYFTSMADKSCPNGEISLKRPVPQTLL